MHINPYQAPQVAAGKRRQLILPKLLSWLVIALFGLSLSVISGIAGLAIACVLMAMFGSGSFNQTNFWVVVLTGLCFSIWGTVVAGVIVVRHLRMPSDRNPWRGLFPERYWDAAFARVTLTCNQCAAKLASSDLSDGPTYPEQGWEVALGNEARRRGWKVSYIEDGFLILCPGCLRPPTTEKS